MSFFLTSLVLPQHVETGHGWELIGGHKRKPLSNSGGHANKRPNHILVRTQLTTSLEIREWNDSAVFWAPEATASSVSQSGTEESNSLPVPSNSHTHTTLLSHIHYYTLSHTLLFSLTYTTILSHIPNYTLSHTLLFSLIYTTLLSHIPNYTLSHTLLYSLSYTTIHSHTYIHVKGV